mgnify:CR=1 FL=1
MPRTIPIQLQEALESSHRTLCYLMKITPTDPDYPAYGVTSLDTDVVYDDGDGEMTYLAAVGFVPSTLITTSDNSVNEQEAKGLLPEFDVPIREGDIIAGVYDFARIKVYLVDYTNLVAGHVILAKGTLGQFTVTDQGLSFTHELRGLSQNLKQSITEKWSLSCRATFGSQPIGTGGGVIEESYPCNYDAESLWEPGAVETVGIENTQTFTTSGLSPQFGGNPGKVRWLTGRNAGRENEVDQFDEAGGVQTIGLTFPTMFPIQPGDTFEFRDDCPKTKAACKARDNWPFFRGEPDIPVGDAGQIATPGASAGLGTGGRLTIGVTDPQ